MESNLPNLLSNKPTIIRHNSYLVMFGAFFAVFICCMAGQINDIIMAVYIPFRFHGDSALFGYTFSAFAAGKLLMMFPMASISEKIGRKLSLTIVYIFYTIGTVLAAVAQNPVQFLIFRFIKGMNAFEAVNLALINDYFLEGKRGPPIAIYSASIGTGILAGNGFGGLFIKWFGMINSFYVLGGFTLLSIFFVLVFVKDNPDQNIHRKNSTFHLRKIALKKLIHSKAYITGASLGGIVAFCNLGMFSFSIYIILNTFNIPSANSGLFLIPFTGIFVIISIILGRKEKARKITIIGFGIIFIGLIGILDKNISENLWIFLISLCIAFAGLGMVVPAIDNYVSSTIPKEIRGEALGIYRSITRIGNVLGTMILGYLGSHFWVFSPYIFVAIISAFSILIGIFFLSENNKMTETLQFNELNQK